MLNSKTRRQSIASIAAVLASPLLPTPTWAQNSAGTGKQDPGISTKPYDLITPSVAGDSNRIRFLFSYDCPYCRSYHNGLTQWGGTLPKPYTFDATPLITSVDNDNQVFAVYGRLIAQALAPAKVPLYDFSMYTMLQGDSDTGKPAKSTVSMEDVLMSLVSIGIDFKAIQSFLNSKGTALQKRIPDHGKLINTYKVTVTPSVALLGRYVVNPDHANSNPSQFLLLLNGMVSRLMHGGPNAI